MLEFWTKLMGEIKNKSEQLNIILFYWLYLHIRYTFYSILIFHSVSNNQIVIMNECSYTVQAKWNELKTTLYFLMKNQFRLQIHLSRAYSNLASTTSIFLTAFRKIKLIALPHSDVDSVWIQKFHWNCVQY